MAGVDYAHQRDIVDQFTRQAEVFADKHSSMHHFLHPTAVLAEMKRACAPGGKAVVIDATLVPAKAEGYNAFEKLRDPSHTRAMPLEELPSLMQQSGLTVEHTRSYWCGGRWSWTRILHSDRLRARRKTNLAISPIVPGSDSATLAKMFQHRSRV